MLPSNPVTILRPQPKIVVAAGGGTLAIDGTTAVTDNGGSTATLVLPGLTTTLANDIIVVDVLSNGTALSTVTSTSGLTFTQHATTTGNDISRWIAKATSALTGEVITVVTPSATFIAGGAYGISGANVSSYPTSSFDGASVTHNTAGASDPTSITTTGTNRLVVSTFRFVGTSNPTAGSGMTQIISGSFMMSDYQAAASAGTFSNTVGTGVGDANGSIIDAFK